jgi:hypothetical protein
MSFAYGHFGAGFSQASPGALALRFGGLVSRRGEDFTLKMRRLSGRDAYGNPSYAEASAALRGFIEEEGGVEGGSAGERRHGTLSLMIPLWAPVEEGDAVEARGATWEVGVVTRNRAYTSAEAKRRGEA